MLKSGFIVGAGHTTSAIFSLIRNVIIARLISVEHFGIASTIAITAALFEIIANIAIERFLVQSKNGNHLGVQKTAHFIQFIAGITSALILFATAHLISAFFDLSDLHMYYQIICLAPLARSFAHLDMFRYERQSRFAASMIVQVLPVIITTLLALPIVYLVSDFRVMLILIVLQQFIYVLMSHIVAIRKYRWSINLQFLKNIIRFGWAPFLNGILIFFILQGDRIIVGGAIGITELGWFAAAYGFTLIPSLVAGRVLHTFFLPLLSRAQHRALEFSQLYVVTCQAAVLFGISVVMAVHALGPFLFAALYGSKYSQGILLLTLLSVVQCIRVVRMGPAIVAMSKGRTANPLVANLARISMLPAAWVTANAGTGISAVLYFAVAGELLALLMSIFLLYRAFELPWRSFISLLFLLVIFLGLSSTMIFWHPPDASTFFQVNSGTAVLLLCFSILVWHMGALRNWLYSSVGRLNPKTSSNQ